MIDTPSTAGVKACYVNAAIFSTRNDRMDEFDNWLTEHTRQAQETAYLEGQDSILIPFQLFPYWGTDEVGGFDLEEPDHDCNRPYVRPELIRHIEEFNEANTNPYEKETP